MQTTVISHIYNEEYLLPFWLEYHKNIFDNIIIINYHSTDNSIEICKKICPNAKIINSRNKDFDAINVDIEVIQLENTINGYKIALNTTEFLICDKPLKEILKNYQNNACIPIIQYCPFSDKNYDIKNYNDIFKNLINNDIVYNNEERIGHRFIHNYDNGNYNIGRHTTNHQIVENINPSLNIIWLGYYPFNDRMIDRKLQIQNRMSERDKQLGLGFHHITTKEKLLEKLTTKLKVGKPLIKLNPNLYKTIQDMVFNLKNILIIGGNGYIGTKLIDKFIKCNFNITVVDTDNNLGLTKKYNNITYICTKYQNLPKSFFEKFTDIILLAGQSSVNNSKNLVNVIDNNINNFSYLLESLNENQKLIYASSSSVYCNTNNKEVDELYFDYNQESYNYYDMSKKAIDNIAKLSNKHYYSLRFGTVNGFSRNLRNDLMINSMIHNSKYNNKIYAANRELCRSILCINDLCKAILKIISDGKYELRGIYNVSSFNCTIDDVLKKVSEITNTEIEEINNNQNIIVNFNNQKNIYNYKLNCDKFKNTFKFEFKGTITSIINKLLKKWHLIENNDNRSIDKYNNYKKINNCIVCNNDLTSLLDLGLQPLANNYVDKNSLNYENKFPLHLNYCKKCYHLNLNCVVNRDNIFKNYIYLSGTSKTLIEYFKKFSKRILKNFIKPNIENNYYNDYLLNEIYKHNSDNLNIYKKEVNNKCNIKILEIACNDGSLLDELYKYNSDKLSITTVGVDPAFNIYNEISSKKKEHDIYCDYFNEDIVNKLIEKYTDFDIIIAQNVIAHIDYPSQFISYIKKLMNNKTTVYLQTSQKNMIIESQFDTVYHEHISFFNTNSMKQLCDKNYLILNNVYEDEIHGCSYIFEINKHKNIKSNLNLVLEEEHKKGLYDITTYNNYKLKCFEYKNNFLNKIIKYKLLNYKIIGFGSTAKSMTIFNFCNITNEYIDFIIDENTLKQGLYTPGSNILTVSIEKIKEINDKCVILITAWNFYNEIKNKIIQKMKEYKIKQNIILINIDSLIEESI